MSQTIEIKQSVDVHYLEVNVEVRYWEDATINGVQDEDGSLIPCRVGDNWQPVIDLDTGVIQDWPANTIADIHYKICDAGIYALLDEHGDTVRRIDGYVPSIMCPNGNGYGDYIIMHVGPDGAISGFDGTDLDEFEQ